MRRPPCPAVKTYWQIFSTMFVVGLFTFGGGLSMIPQMTRVFSAKRKWVEEEEIVEYFAVAQSLPGAVAINTSVLIGTRLAGVPGAVFAALGSVLPSFLVLLPVTVFYHSFLRYPVMLGALRGIRAAVSALLFSAVWGLRKGTLRHAFDYALCLVCAALVILLDLNPVWIILGCLFLGAVFFICRGKSEPQ